MNGSLSVCVTNSFRTPASGTLNTSTGAASLDLELNSDTVLTATPLQPCPICAVSVGGAACNGTPASPCTGVCDGGQSQGAVCVSRNPNGLSKDCPSPVATGGAQRCFRGTNNGMLCPAGPADCPSGVCAQYIGTIPISLNPLTTGVASKTNLSGQDNATCTGAGTPTSCCTGVGTGSCNVFCPGQTGTTKGAFKSDICTAGANSGLPCFSNANCPGSACRSGTFTNYCLGGTADGKGCNLSADCTGGGTCVKAGTLAQQVRETGVAGSGGFALNTPKAVTLASVFCVGVTTNGTVNSNANLPGPGATSLPGTITTLP
jgi:hypothetical protein